MADTSDLKNNPFVALFGSESEAHLFRELLMKTETTDNAFLRSLSKTAPTDDLLTIDKVATTGLELEDKPSIVATEDVLLFSSIMEQIFLITLDNEPSPEKPPHCVYLEEFCTSRNGQDWLELEFLSQAVFERIMFESSSYYVIKTSPTQSRYSPSEDEALEPDPLKYLAESYCRMTQMSSIHQDCKFAELFAKSEEAIMTNAKLCFLQPDIVPSTKPSKYFFDLIASRNTELDSVVKFYEVVAVHVEEEGPTLEAFRPILDELKDRLSKGSLSDSNFFGYIDLVELFFCHKPCLAQTLLSYNRPKEQDSGSSYERTFFGAILSVSCLVRTTHPPYEFFAQPGHMTQGQVDQIEGLIYPNLDALQQKIYQIFYSLLKMGGQIKEELLLWLGNCLHANRGRTKIWTHQMPDIFGLTCDGFFLNLGAVLLQLSAPFSEPESPKLLNIQPTYYRATLEEQSRALARKVHMREIKESTLLPAHDQSEHPPPPPYELEEAYNFTTECFFMTHYCFHLGFRVVHEQFVKLNQELHRMQANYQELVQQGIPATDESIQRLKNDIEKITTIYLCQKSGLTQPSLLDRHFTFFVATATYLSQMACRSETASQSGQFEEISYPLPTSSPATLRHLPEFLVENIQDFMIFLKRFKDSFYEQKSEHLRHLLTFILVFMGNAQFMRNPHLRAGMAEALECLIPNEAKQTSSTFQQTHFYRERLFSTHEHVKQVAPTLVNIFVSIEMTGQGVQFEHKFRYRQPMYIALKFLWKIKLHRNIFREMAIHSEQHIEDTDAPLFLRFINLLTNDAIYLLDEALSHMSQIKEKQEEKESGDWERLSNQQQREAEAGYRHLSMLAKFHNIMSNETISTLEMMTRDIRSIFTHGIMVDRIAAMLNYFLLHLVGPKKRNLKVKNFDEFQFQPKILVANICKIYLHLGNDDRFCHAVAQDGRSYSHELFVQAEGVLCKIGQPVDEIAQFNELGTRIQAMATQQAEEDEALVDIPEDYLDPIMGCIMKDPVLLPSSGKIVDRQTIARHILSDQFDPFNRQPLTMDMVKPADELRKEIENWIAESRKK